MARRRPVQSATASPVVPDALLGGQAGLIERWLSPADQARVRRDAGEHLQHHPRSDEERAVDAFLWLSVATRHRLRVAREEWAADRGLTWWEAIRLIREAERGHRGAPA